MGYAPERLSLFSFDEQYVRQLQEQVAAVEEHFTTYFQKLLTNYLRRRIKSPEMIEDIRQETLLRVLFALRRGAGLRRPECLGAFVMAVCGNVLREFVRGQFPYTQIGEHPAPADAAPDPESQAMAREFRASVSSALAQLAERDRHVLAITLLEERSPHDAGRRLGLKESHVRVVLHRAKARLRNQLRGTSRYCACQPA